MDEVTQQNAALVEEAAAASKSLEDQGHQLTESVAFFRLVASYEDANTGQCRPA
jgi:methyl-accepting chemotaxis protein-1 (serine sensor receptor)